MDAQIPVADGEEAGSGLVEAALEISRKRTQMMEQMRKALETGDEKQALSLARLLVGLGQTPAVMVITALLPVILV
ncbi:MAG: hypothetical protein K6U02_01580 [Firmicutes bacterium]|nr:hypothetical protein [Bacillota bacterium]